MISFLAGFVLGALVGGLIYRNNATKAKTALDLLVIKYEDTKKKLEAEIAKQK